MRKKKILVAVLASLCVAASAAGVAACSSSPADSTAHDPALYAAYQKYAPSDMTYDEWVAYILDMFYSSPEGPAGKDGVYIENITRVTVNGVEYYEFTFSNGKVVRLAVDGSGRMETTSFTFKAVDQRGTPIANVYFSVGYATSSANLYLREDGSLTGDPVEAAVVKTDEEGIATFYTFPSNTTIEYSVFIANPEAIDNAEPVPKGYLDNYFGADELGIVNSSAPMVKDADGNYSVTVTFNISSGWRAEYNSANDLIYKRDPNGTVTYEPYVKNALKYRYNYFTLNPFTGTYTDDYPEMEAASGVYRLSWTADDPNANVELTLYAFMNGEYYFSNADGSPSEVLVSQRSGTLPTDESVLRERYQSYRNDGYRQSYETWLSSYAKTFSGANYVDVQIDYDDAFHARCLSFVADMDCTVTIEVERINDVPTWTDEYVEASISAGVTKADEVTGRIIDVPLNSTIVRDDKGLYHIDSVTGPVIYVQLAKATRVNTSSILELCEYTVDGYEGTRSMFSDFITEEFDPYTNAGVRTHTDYSAALIEYGKLANSDGLYPVNDQLKFVLETFCTNMSGWTNYDEYWVAACSYYGPESNGSIEAPYDLAVGTNTIQLNGTTYVAFKSYTTGYYAFTSDDAEFTIEGGINVDGTNYIKFNANEEIVFAVTGSGSTATINIATFSAKNIIEASYDSDLGVQYGTDANPINIDSEGLYQVNIDHGMSNGSRITVNLAPLYLLGGEFLIEVYGGPNVQVVDANNQSLDGRTVTATMQSPVRMWVDDAEDGTFFIKITLIKSEFEL